MGSQLPTPKNTTVGASAAAVDDSPKQPEVKLTLRQKFARFKKEWSAKRNPTKIKCSRIDERINGFSSLFHFKYGGKGGTGALIFLEDERNDGMKETRLYGIPEHSYCAELLCWSKLNDQ